MSFLKHLGYEYQKIKLASHAKFYFMKTPGKKVFYIRVIVKCGSMFENIKNSGISHLLEHLIFNGNKRLGNAELLNLKLESLPGDINAFTSFDRTEFWYSLEVFNYAAGIKHFCDLLFYPSFEGFEKEKKVVLEEIKSDYNQSLTQNTNIFDITNSLLWPNQALGRPVAGRPSTIKNLTKQSVINYYQRHYQPANMIFSVVGDVDCIKITKILNANIPVVKHRLTTLPVKKFSLFKHNKNLIKWINTDSLQLDFIWSFALEGLSLPEMILTELFCDMLDDGFSGRLPKYLRTEYALVYDLEASVFRHNKASILLIRAQLSHDNILNFFLLLADLMLQLAENGFTNFEFEHHIKRQISKLNCVSDFDTTFLNHIIEGDIYWYLSLSRYLKLLHNVDLATVNQLVKKFVLAGKSVLTLSGSKNLTIYKKLSAQYQKFFTRKL